MMKIVADQAIPYVSRLFSQMGTIELIPGREIVHTTLIDCEVLLVRSVTAVNKALLHDTSVRYVASATSGIDHIDVKYLHDNDITFMHAPGCNAESVCQYVLSSVFCLHDQFAFELENKQVGIVGYGNVGRRLAHYLAVLDFSVNIYDPFIQDDAGHYPYQDLDKVLDSDILSLHVPLTEAGRYPSLEMIDTSLLSSLRSDIMLINSSRGEVVDEKALLDFLHENPNAHAVLDVWANEPYIDTHLLTQASIATPHIAGYSLDAKCNATWMIYTQLAECLHMTERVAYPLLPSTKTQPLKLKIDDEIDAVKMAILASYDVRSDSAALRRIVEFQKPSQAAFFDALRVNYPIRRDFSDMRIQVLSDSERVRNRLHHLGFTLS